MNYLWLILFCAVASAEQKVNLFKKEEVKAGASSVHTLKHNKSSAGNLPQEYGRRGRYVADENPVVLPTQKSGVGLSGLKIGEVIEASIPESVFAFYESRLPIRAIVSRGAMKGAVLIGEASLERNSKRIVIDFKKLRGENSSELWVLQGSSLDSKGVIGLPAKIISNEGKYFTAELLAAAAAGYADASIQRSQNTMGNYVETPSADTINKKALTSALSRTADRFAEKIKAAPEYAILEGPVSIQILITEPPRLSE